MSSLAKHRVALFGAPREIVPGKYHVTDLLRRPAATVYDWHTGQDAPTGIPGWLSIRGEKMEEAMFEVLGIPESARHPELNLDLGGGARVVGHPEYVAAIRDTGRLDEDGAVVLEAIDPRRHQEDDVLWVEIGEAKSQLSSDDPAREDVAMEQNLTYEGLRRMGGTFTFPWGTWDDEEHGRLPVTHARPILGGMWDINDDNVPTINHDAAKALAEYVVNKARTLHESIQTGNRALVEEFDQAQPPMIQDVEGPAPVAQGEEAQVADDTVMAYVAYKFLEERYDLGRDRFKARWVEEWESSGEPDLAKKPTVKEAAPVGGRLQLWTKTKKEVMDSEELDKARAELDQLEADWGQIQDAALADLRADHADLLDHIEEQQQTVNELKENLTVETKVPDYVRVVGHGDIDAHEALAYCFREYALDQDNEDGEA